MDTPFSSRAAIAVIAAAVIAIMAFALAAIYATGQARAATPTTVTSTDAAATAPGITVTGTAKVAGTPDTLKLDLSVSFTEHTVSAALDKANAATAKMLAALKQHGVDGKDLQTSGLSIQPEYNYPNNKAPIITGYQVSQSLTAKLRNISKAGAAITAAADAGGNAVRVNGISLDLEATSSLAAAARDRAVADAKAKAEQYAKASGRGLGGVVSINEAVTSEPPVNTYGAFVPQKALAGRDIAIEPGSQNVQVTVTVVYAFS